MKTRIIAVVLFLIGATQTSIAQTEKWTSGRADGHAPMGVMADHVHHKGEWMVSYRMMHMAMEGNLSGSDAISNEEIFANYMVAPQNMTMQMHMFGLMYAPSDKLTLCAMANVLDNDMELLTSNSMMMMPMMRNVTFETASQGFGDVKVGALYQLFNKDRRTMHVNLAVSIPTGSLTETGVTPMSSPDETRLGYAMQLGSGTWDINLGATYLKQYENMSFGAQTSYLYRTGENEEGYTLGNKWNATFWTAYKFHKKFSTSLRVDYNNIASIEGSDRTFMNPMMATVFDATNSGKKQLDLLLGLNYGIFKGALKGLRFQVEGGIPVVQNVEGIQMETTYVLTAGLQYAFGGH